MASPPLSGSPSEALGEGDGWRVPRRMSTLVKREQAILFIMKDLKLAQNNIVLILDVCGIIAIKTPLCDVYFYWQINMLERFLETLVTLEINTNAYTSHHKWLPEKQLRKHETINYLLVYEAKVMRAYGSFLYQVHAGPVCYISSLCTMLLLLQSEF